MAGHESSVVYLTAFVIAVLLFSSGVIAGIFVLQWRNRGMENEMKLIMLRVDDMNLQAAMMESSGDCSVFHEFMKSLMKEMGAVESKFNEMENGSKLNQYDMKYLREKYQLLSLRYYLSVSKFPQCMQNTTVILYFYDNGKNCRSCEDQGVILMHIKKKYGDHVLIFPFDHSLNLTSINLLEAQYHVSSYPSVIVNGKLHGFMSLNELEQAVNG